MSIYLNCRFSYPFLCVCVCSCQLGHMTVNYSRTRSLLYYKRELTRACATITVCHPFLSMVVWPRKSYGSLRGVAVPFLSLDIDLSAKFSVWGNSSKFVEWVVRIHKLRQDTLFSNVSVLNHTIRISHLFIQKKKHLSLFRSDETNCVFSVHFPFLFPFFSVLFFFECVLS